MVLAGSPGARHFVNRKCESVVVGNVPHKNILVLPLRVQYYMVAVGHDINF